MNQAVLEGRQERFEEMLALLDLVTDEELALTAAEHRIHGLHALGRGEEAEAAAAPVFPVMVQIQLLPSRGRLRVFSPLVQDFEVVSGHFPGFGASP